jgi:folate-binding protein YgfZ
MKAFNLVNRKLLAVTGKDSRKFLQGIITNDINLLTEKNAIFTAYLNPQGRFLGDFFLYQYNDKIIIDIDHKFIDALIKKFNLYKLAAETNIEIIQAQVISTQDQTLINEIFNNPIQGACIIKEQNIFALDNRSVNLGLRVILFNNKINFDYVEDSYNQYNLLRLRYNIIDGAEDLIIEKSIILEFAYHKIPAINFDKGCYLGQELMTRTYRTGVIRKKPYNFIIKNPDNLILGSQAKIIYNEQKIGVVCSLYRQDQDIAIMSLCKIDDIPFEKAQIKHYNGANLIKIDA